MLLWYGELEGKRDEQKNTRKNTKKSYTFQSNGQAESLQRTVSCGYSNDLP